MIDPAIVDAGPALNFFSINKERLLFEAIGGKIAVPETVAREISEKSVGMSGSGPPPTFGRSCRRPIGCGSCRTT
jgi:hypothetical protein